MEKTSKKWSLGVLFRKNKKDVPQADFSSDEEDRKAGFNPDVLKKSPQRNKTNRQLVESFDQKQYSVANPEFHYYKQTYVAEQPRYVNEYEKKIYMNQQNMELMKNQINLEKNRLAQPQYIQNHQGSSQDEKSSYNSLSPSKCGSDGSRSRKTRSARNERYYQRIQRDDGRPMTIYGSVNSIENYNNNLNNQTHYNNYTPQMIVPQNRLSASLKSASLCSADFANPNYPVMMRNFNPVQQQIDNRDDYENIHTVDDTVPPPPIPPRDPNRRLSINSSIMKNPLYFDHQLQKYVVFNNNGKCFSDDKLWKSDADYYTQQQQQQQQQQLHHQPTTNQLNHHQPNNKRPLSIKSDHYTDYNNEQKSNDILQPRSRKPLNLSSNLDKEMTTFNSEDMVDNARIEKRSKSALDFPKLMRESTPIQSRPISTKQEPKYSDKYPLTPQNPTKTFCGEELLALRKKYSSENDINQNQNKLSIAPQNKQNFGNLVGNQKSVSYQKLRDEILKPKMSESVASNLDEAINELESMYVHLMKDEELIDRATKRDNSIPSKFEALAKSYDDFENEENDEKEPDIVKDDVFSRNLKRANQSVKVVESQPPFGIPIGPIPPKPVLDYLSVEPVQLRKQVPSQNNPDVIADDLAVRNLRKDNPIRRNQNIQMDNNHYTKRNHTLSAISDDIYNEILRNSTKPCGGKMNEAKSEKDVRSSLYLVKDQSPKVEDRKEFEQTLDALVIESKAISQKLEKDLSKLKRESVTPTKRTMMQILTDTTRKPAAVEKKSTSCSPIAFSPKTEKKESPSKEKSVKTTACSPITDIELFPESPKTPKSEKIGNLIEMFNKNDTPVIQKPLERPMKKSLSSPLKMRIDESKIILPLKAAANIAAPVVSPPITAPVKPALTPVKPREATPIISPIMSPIMSPISPKTVTRASPATSTSLIAPVVPINIKEEKQITDDKIIDIESNINNIKELIQQIKATDFETNSKIKFLQNEIPDYDNIRNDYAMLNGKLERIQKSEDKLQEDKSHAENSAPEDEESYIRESSKDSKESTDEIVSTDESVDIFNNAVEYLNGKSADDEAPKDEIEKVSVTKTNSSNQQVAVETHPKPQKPSLDESEKSSSSEEIPKFINVREKIHQLENKISYSRQEEQVQSSSTESKIKSPTPTSPAVLAPTPTATQLVAQSPVKPDNLSKLNQQYSDTESQYNSTEELSMIFGISEPQTIATPSSAPHEQSGKLDVKNKEHDFDVVDENHLNEFFDMALNEINNSDDKEHGLDWFDTLVEPNDPTEPLEIDILDDLMTDDLSSLGASTSGPSTSSSTAAPTTSLTTNLMSGNSSLSQAISNYETQCNKRLLKNQSNRCSNNSDDKLCQQHSSSNQLFRSNTDFLKTRCILLACTYCITNNDLFTVLVIIIAILTLISVLVM